MIGQTLLVGQYSPPPPPPLRRSSDSFAGGFPTNSCPAIRTPNIACCRSQAWPSAPVEGSSAVSTDSSPGRRHRLVGFNRLVAELGRSSEVSQLGDRRTGPRGRRGRGTVRGRLGRWRVLATRPVATQSVGYALPPPARPSGLGLGAGLTGALDTGAKHWLPRVPSKASSNWLRRSTS